MSNEKMLTPEQCRAARGLLDWSQDELAEAARVSRPTVVSFEGGQRVPVPNNLLALRRALEEAGVELIAENGGGPGVRLKRRPT